MRENIGLYRGKRKDNGEWIEGAYSPYNWNFFGEREEKPQIIIISDDKNIDGLWCEVIPETVGEFTGCFDKSKTARVYEHDIVWDEIDEYYGVVEFDEGEFIVNFDGVIDADRFADVISCCYVVGNIYDNPELLENASKPDAENIAQDVMRPATPEGADNFELMPG